VKRKRGGKKGGQFVFRRARKKEDKNLKVNMGAVVARR